MMLFSLVLNAEDRTKERYNKIKHIIAQEASRYKVPNERLTALLYTESRFKRYAKSPTGSYGIAQFTRTKAKEMNVNRSDVHSSIRGAARLLKKEYDNTIKSFTVKQRWNLACIYYNRGKGYHFKAKEYMKRHKIKLTYNNLIKQYSKYKYMKEGLMYCKKINEVIKVWCPNKEKKHKRWKNEEKTRC